MKNITLCIIFILFVISCEAPRENPFDPASPNFKALPNPADTLAVTQLTVHTLNAPFSGISGAMVNEANTHFFGTTDAQGRISWRHVKRDSLRFTVSADGYFTRSTLFSGLGLRNTVELSLNARPQILEMKLNSFYQNTANTTYLTLNAIIEDQDGIEDINPVVAQCSDYDFKDTLELENPLTQNFYCQFTANVINDSLSAGQLPELNFVLIVKNLNDDSLVSVPISVKRVIDEYLELLLPVNSSTQSDSVLFRWQRVDLDFPFFYNILLQRLEDDARFNYKNIPSADSTYVVKNLDPGTYFWQLQIEDRPGNICQSLFKSFHYVR